MLPSRSISRRSRTAHATYGFRNWLFWVVLGLDPCSPDWFCSIIRENCKKIELGGPFFEVFKPERKCELGLYCPHQR